MSTVAVSIPSASRAAKVTMVDQLETGEVVSEVSPEERKRLREELHARILAGEIDMGPVTEHEPINPDLRPDNRNPADLGDAILTVRKNFGLTITQAADEVDRG